MSHLTTKREWPRRLAVVVVFGAGLLGWRGAFGLFATDRRLEWRLPVAAGEVRALDLQLWADEALVRREQRAMPEGLTEAVVWSLPLARGDYQAVATVELAEGRTVAFRTRFDPGGDEVSVIVFR